MTDDNISSKNSRSRTDLAQWSAAALLLSGVVLTYLSIFLGGNHGAGLVYSWRRQLYTNS